MWVRTGRKLKPHGINTTNSKMLVLMLLLLLAAAAAVVKLTFDHLAL